MKVKCDFCTNRTKETITVFVHDDSYEGCEALFEVCPKCGEKYLEGERCVANGGLHMEVGVPKRVFGKAIMEYLGTQ